MIAALLLYNYGSGPIKGFAVTLSIGIITSMFTALILTKLIVSLWVVKLRPNRLFLTKGHENNNFYKYRISAFIFLFS